MKYELTQTELIEATQYYLNEKMLKTPVKVMSVKPISDASRGGGLTVAIETTMEQLET